MNEFEPSMEDMSDYLSGLGQEQATTAFQGATPLMYLEEDMGASKGGPGSGPAYSDIVQGQWIFRVQAGGRVSIIQGPGTGSTYSPGSARHAEIIANLMGQSPEAAALIIRVYPEARGMRAPASPPPPAPSTPRTSTPTLTTLPAIPDLGPGYNDQEEQPFYQNPTFQWVAGGVAVLGLTFLAWRYFRD